MSEETIWYRNGEQKVGPFSISTIKELREKDAISGETLVSDDNGTTWTAYDKFLVSIENIKSKTVVEESTNIPPIILPSEPSISGRKEPIFSRNSDKSVTSDENANVSSFNNIKENAGTPKKKRSISKHLFYGFIFSLGVAFVLHSISKDLHLITVNFIFNFETHLIPGYFFWLVGMLGAATGLWLMGCIGLIFHPAIYYVLILLFGFLASVGSTLNKEEENASFDDSKVKEAPLSNRDINKAEIPLSLKVVHDLLKERKGTVLDTDSKILMFFDVDYIYEGNKAIGLSYIYQFTEGLEKIFADKLVSKKDWLDGFYPEMLKLICKKPELSKKEYIFQYVVLDRSEFEQTRFRITDKDCTA